MTACRAETKRRVGRPSVTINPEQVDEMKRQGLSWRRIARVLGIGTATAMRLLRSIERAGLNVQNTPPKTQGGLNRAQSDVDPAG